MSGDRILVEEDSRSFTAMGATSGQTNVTFTDQTISAMQAIAQVGDAYPEAEQPADNGGTVDDAYVEPVQVEEQNVFGETATDVGSPPTSIVPIPFGSYGSEISTNPTVPCGLSL